MTRRKWPRDADLKVTLRLTPEQRAHLLAAWQGGGCGVDFEHWLIFAAYFRAWYQEEQRKWIEAARPGSATEGG